MLAIIIIKLHNRFPGHFPNFSNTFREFGSELVFGSVAACRLVNLIIRFKEKFLKFLEELLFETTMHMIEFSAEVQNAEIFSITLLKGDSTKGASKHLKVIGLLTGNLCGGVRFQYSYRWYIRQLKLLKRSPTKNIIVGIFLNFQNSNFANIT